MVGERQGLVLAVDGGQSSTLALVADEDGHILGAGLAGPSNHVHEPGGMARLSDALRRSITAALQQAGRDAGDVVSACLGMTGGPQEAREIARRLLPAATVEACQDIVTALAGAGCAQPGVVVIAGTGSVAYGRLGDGREAKAGGWGYLMGDEGSGYDIGRAALRAATQASDGRSAPTRLLERVPAHFGFPDLAALHRAIYAGEVARPRLAELTAVVGEAARAGDAVAQAILAQAGRDLASAALAVITRLGHRQTGLTTYYTGGVFRAGAPVLEPFRHALQAGSPRSDVRPAAFSPVVGGLFLALQAAGHALTGQRLRAIEATLPPPAISKT